MARTYRDGKHPDGKAQTTRGLDRCPPASFRRSEATKPERAAGRTIERLALRVDADDLPAYGRAVMPHYT